MWCAQWVRLSATDSVTPEVVREFESQEYWAATDDKMLPLLTFLETSVGKEIRRIVIHQLTSTHWALILIEYILVAEPEWSFTSNDHNCSLTVSWYGYICSIKPPFLFTISWEMTKRKFWYSVVTSKVSHKHQSSCSTCSALSLFDSQADPRWRLRP